MKSFVNFSENLDDKRKQLMQKQRVMQQLEKERASRTNQEFQQKKEEKDQESGCLYQREIVMRWRY